MQMLLIICRESFQQKIVELLEDNGVEEYTVIEKVRGAGKTGVVPLAADWLVLTVWCWSVRRAKRHSPSSPCSKPSALIMRAAKTDWVFRSKSSPGPVTWSCNAEHGPHISSTVRWASLSGKLRTEGLCHHQRRLPLTRRPRNS